MEELKAGWRKVKLGDIIDFNPKETLKKNTISKYVEMAQLQCFARNIIGYSFKEYKGGTKFRNGDTLLARITPCLENGKTAFVDILEEDEVGFGSTEYIVLRKKEGYTDENYIFYLAISDLFRQIAIKSMTGTSGRQRVQTEVLKNSEIVIPEVNIQKKIASILSLLDEKIELNRKINQNLEETAQTLFKRWFIDFEFPNEEGKPYKSNGGKMIESELGEIPEGWRVGKLANYFSDIISGDWGKELPQNNYIEEVNCIKGADIIDITKGNKNKVVKRFILSKNFKNKKLQHGDLIVEISGGSPTQSTGRITYVNSEILKKLDNKVITTNFCKVLRLKNHILYPYIYLYWKYFYLNNLFFQFENGTTGIKNLDINSILNSENLFIIPCDNIISLFSKIIDIKFTFIQKKGNEIEKLIELRDYLLPRLMSGKIDVSNLKIFEILNSDKFN